MMKNESGINPVGWRILVLPREIEEKTESGIILTTEVTKEREQLANTTGIVVAMGNQCYNDEPAKWCQVGDKIIFAKYAGLTYRGKNGKIYRMINDKDVTGRLDNEVDLVDPYLVAKK
jgi:co-chaperonin GroES (HSP10)